METELTKILGIKYPILLAGMNVAAGPELAAAVCNAGGMGTIGGVFYTPEFLKEQIAELKEGLDDKNAPFGVDLLLPQVGGNARKTNYDYTEGHLPELIDVIIEGGAKVFVCAVGTPPRWVVDKLHSAGILVMNMIGAPKHVPKVLQAGVDIICAQGGEGGGHTGDIATSILIPSVVDLARGYKSPLLGCQIPVVAAGGIYDGRGLAMALVLGAQAAWVGTRFVCAQEAGAPPRHKNAIVECDFNETVRTLIYTGRPMRVIKNDYIMNWHDSRAQELKELCDKGVIPVRHDAAEMAKRQEEVDAETYARYYPLLSGACAGAIKDVRPAKEIVDSMVKECLQTLHRVQGYVKAKL